MLAEDERVDVVRALVGVHRLQVDHVAEDRVVAGNPIRAQDVARLARTLQRHPDVVLLQQRDVCKRRLAFLLQPAHLQRQQLPLGDFRQHPHQLLLHQLMPGDGLARPLLALLGIIERGLVALHGRAQRAPTDAVARLRQAAERRPQPVGLGQAVASGNLAVAQRQPAGDGRPQRILVMHVPSLQARRALLYQEAANLSVVVLGPHQRHVGHRPVGDPQLLAVQHVALALLARRGQHPARVRPEAGLGQPEAAQGLTFLQTRQPLLLLLLRAVGEDGIHHQRALHRDEAAQPGVAPLQLLHNQAVLHRRHPGAAIAFQVRSQVAQPADFRDQFGGKGAGLRVLLDDGLDVLLHPLPHRGPHHFLIFRQQ